MSEASEKIYRIVQVINSKNEFMEDGFYVYKKKKILFIFSRWKILIEDSGVGSFWGWPMMFKSKQSAELYIQKLKMPTIVNIVN